MATTKTYQYLDNGALQSTDVTVTIGGCPYNAPVTGDGSTTYLDIEATIPAAVAGDIYVDIEVTAEFYGYYNSGTQVYIDQILIPAGSTTSGVISKACNDKDTDNGGNVTSETIITYVFLEQQNVPVENPPLSLSHTKTDASCFGSLTGTIAVSITGGTSPFSYAWSDGGPDQATRNALPAGTYSVTVTDSNAQTATISDIVIAQPTELAAAGTITAVSCNGGSNGSIAITPSGGVGGYRYRWNDGSTTQNRISLTAGTYTLTLTDDNGCSKSFSFTVGQPTQIAITVQIEGKNASVSGSGGTAPYSYFWSDNVAAKDRFDMPNGEYTVTVTDDNNCQASATVVIDDFKFFFSKNPVWLELSAADPETKANLSFQLDVYLEEAYKSAAFGLKYSTQHPARADGSTDFDVREILNAYLSAVVPAFGESDISQVSEAFKRFYLEHAEVYGEPPVPAPITQVDTFYVLFGGLSEQEFAKSIFFDEYLSTQKPFLTWQPRKKDVVARQHEYLHFVVISNSITSLQLWARLKYDDGSESDLQLRSVSGVQPYEVYRFPAGAGQLALEAVNPAKALASYTLYLKSGLEVVSEERTYKLLTDQSYYRIFLYNNSVGGWDTQLAKGRGRTRIRTSEESIDRELPVGYTYSTRAKEVTSKTGKKSAEVVIGNLTTAEKKHLEDLAISEQVYEQTASGYLPVDIKFDFDPSDEMQELDEEVSMEVTYPTIKKYTPEL